MILWFPRYLAISEAVINSNKVTGAMKAIVRVLVGYLELALIQNKHQWIGQRYIVSRMENG
jgi:hypothetical protein